MVSPLSHNVAQEPWEVNNHHFPKSPAAGRLSVGSGPPSLRGVQAGYRLARLAVKFGAEILLDDLIVRISADCAWRDDPRGSGCGARFPDLPPDLPARAMRVIVGGKG
jgi:hypothetical protein